MLVCSGFLIGTTSPPAPRHNQQNISSLIVTLTVMPDYRGFTNRTNKLLRIGGVHEIGGLISII